jgi:Asp-tRNA(Asn)/Glu-tRNA(Gln) amidotransferase A subunit family amidase
VPTVDAESVATSTRFTRIFSALGWPALSVPAGTDSESRPVGVHLTAPRGLASMLAVGAMIEGLLAA